MAEHIAERYGGQIVGVIQGKEETIDLLLMALFAGGLVLMEDVPGVGKTMLAKTMPTLKDGAGNPGVCSLSTKTKRPYRWNLMNRWRCGAAS